MDIMKLNAQTAINMIAYHLLGPDWDLSYQNLSNEEKNTLLVNRIYVKYPKVCHWPSIIDIAIKGRMKRW